MTDFSRTLLLLLGALGCAPQTGDSAKENADTAPDTADSAGDDTAASEEVCNGKDDNLDGTIDEAGAVGCEDAWRDGDGDGYGGDVACVCPGAPGFVDVGGDCNDELACMTTECGSESYGVTCGSRGVLGYRFVPVAFGDFTDDGVVDSVDYWGRVIRTPEAGMLAVDDAVVAELEFPWATGSNSQYMANGLYDYDADGRVDYVRVQAINTYTEEDGDEFSAMVVWVPAVGEAATVAWTAQTPSWPSYYTSLSAEAVLGSDIDDDGDVDLGLLQAAEDGEGYFWLTDEGVGEALDSSNALFPVAWTSRYGDVMWELGDVDGDGADDLLWGEGLFYGPLSSTLTGSPDLEVTGLLGQSAGAADLDGDGHRELFAGSFDRSWQVAETPAASAAWSDQVLGSLLPNPPEGYAWIRASAGDLDGDGGDELLVGFSSDTPDIAYVWSGPLIGERLVTESEVAWPGYGSQIYAWGGAPSTGEVAVWVSNPWDYDLNALVLLPF